MHLNRSLLAMYDHYSGCQSGPPHPVPCQGTHTTHKCMHYTPHTIATPLHCVMVARAQYFLSHRVSSLSRTLVYVRLVRSRDTSRES